jgi:AraC-like DNA-binding protein
MNSSEIGPSLRSFSFFQAPAKPIRPYVIGEKEEVVELLLAGKVFFETTNSPRQEYGRGALFWHYPGEHTVYEANLKNPYYCMAFRFHTQGESFARKPKVSIWKREEELDAFMREMVDSYFVGTPHSSDYHSYVYHRLAWQTIFSPSASSILDENQPKLKKLLEHIDLHLERDWNVDSMARHIDVSASCLHQWFLTLLSTTPHQALLQKRLSHARFLLAGSSQPIKEIVQRCGFKNGETFYRCFKKYTECTPREYRVQNQLSHLS